MDALPEQFIFSFGGGAADGRSSMKNLLGGKGANLAEMASLGLPIPPGFTISTEICGLFYTSGKRLPEPVKTEILTALAKVEKTVGRKFGNPENPLLVSV
ncbi:MAG: pyruvate, phosphate dikinase, partial [Bdellovibrionales bacterium]|nr:pyruvate, phosphate dikinase [Bdellovibrionales bacterium]